MCDVSDRVDGVLCARHGDGDREIVYDRDGCTAKRGPIVCADGRTGKPVRQWTYARPGKDHLQRATLGDFDASRPGLELAAVGKKEGMGGLILWSRAGRPAWRKDIPAGWVTCGVRVGLCDHIGCGRDELMRVLGPRGALCVHESGRWAKTVRPRPKGMDDWTHPHHGPDGNMVSRDRMLRFPIGLRWIGGLPKTINSFASGRGWVLANGRCYIVSSSVVDNLPPRHQREDALPDLPGRVQRPAAVEDPSGDRGVGQPSALAQYQPPGGG